MKVEVNYACGFPIKDAAGKNLTTLKYEFTESQLEGFITSFIFRQDFASEFSFKDLDKAEGEQVIDHNEIMQLHQLNMDAEKLEEINEYIDPQMGNRVLMYEDGSLTVMLQYSSEKPHNREFLQGLVTGIRLLYPDFDFDSVKYEKNIPFTIESWNKANPEPSS